MQGEQVWISVTVFNYMTVAVEATVVLHGSPDYIFTLKRTVLWNHTIQECLEVTTKVIKLFIYRSSRPAETRRFLRYFSCHSIVLNLSSVSIPVVLTSSIHAREYYRVPSHPIPSGTLNHKEECEVASISKWRLYFLRSNMASRQENKQDWIHGWVR